MKEQESLYRTEKLSPKVYEGEILPPLPKPVRLQEAAQVEERLKVVRTELIHYIEKPTPPPRVIVVERQAPPPPESVWEEIGSALMDGVAGVRGFLGEMTPIWRGLRR